MNRSRKLTLVLIGTLIQLSSVVDAQENDPKQPEQAPSKEITIVDEPRSIDPATLMGEQLAKPASVTFDETSLTDVAAWVQKQTGLPVVLDRRSLDEYGILASEPITDGITEEPVYLLLDRLSAIGVSWRNVDNIIHIDAIDDEHVYTRQYNVGDLFDAGHDVDLLQATIEGCVSPESWETTGGSGSIILLGDVMFVRQSNHVHRQVGGLLTALRKHARRTMILEPPQHQKLRDSLARPVTLKSNDIALAVVASQLSTLADADIRLDAQALDNAGIRQRQPIDLSIEQQPLSLVLDLISQHYDLAWQLKDGVLWLTTPDAIAVVTAVYDVRDLCRDDNESTALLDAIHSQTIPESWDAYGGEGTIEFPLPGTMVVSQTGRGQDAVLELLETYRSALRASKPRKQQDPNPIVTHFYLMPSNVATNLMPVLPSLIASDSWQSDEQPKGIGTIRILESWSKPVAAGKQKVEGQPLIPYSVLVVKQRQEVHEDIMLLLQKIEHGDIPVSGGMMGGGGGGFGGGFFNIPSHPSQD